MNAPDPIATAKAEFRVIALDRLVPSRTNPRTRRGFDEASLNELAASIRSVGVAQPILVRPLRDNPLREGIEEFARFEIIAGERRFRASRIAGLAEMPALVRDLGDTEVLHVQLIENIQRKDLDAMEEAEGYEKLLKQQDSAGQPYTAERIAELMGVSKGTIYARLKLLALCPEARQAFFDGELDASRALLLARIPVHKLQLQALKEITRKLEYGVGAYSKDDTMSYRKAREWIQEKFMLDLERAPFSLQDAALLPRAGSCTGCLKRTGNAAELFDDVKGKDVCTDPTCFALKKTAHVLAIQKEAEARGDAVIVGKDAKKLIPNNWCNPEQLLENNGYAALDSLAPGEKRTWKALLKEKKLIAPGKEGKEGDWPVVKKVLIENPYTPGKMIETVNIEGAIKALREAGYEIKPKAGGTQSPRDSEESKREAEQLRQAVEQEQAYRTHLHQALRAKIRSSLSAPGGPHPELYSLLAETAVEDLADTYNNEIILHVMQLFAPDIKVEEDDERKAVEEFQKRIPALTPQDHFLLLLDLVMTPELGVDRWNVRNKKTPEILHRVARIEGVDAGAIRKEIK